MPTLPLSSGFSVIPQGGDLPVTDSADVIATLPSIMQPNQAAPVRDALCAALAAAIVQYQELSGYAAAQCDILRATDQYLIALAEERGYFQQAGESQEAYRSRVLSVPSLVTPVAILALANALLAPFTAVQCAYFESVLDRWFVSDGPNGRDSFVGAGPSYVDRLYQDPSVTDGTRIAGREAGGAWVFNDTAGRFFVLRVPVILDSDIALEYAGYNDATGLPVLLSSGDLTAPELGGAEFQTGPAPTGSLPATAGGRGMFVADGSNTGGSEADGTCATFLYRGGASALSVYQTIVNSVERIRGQGIRWMLFVDPTLS